MQLVVITVLGLSPLRGTTELLENVNHAMLFLKMGHVYLS